MINNLSEEMGDVPHLEDYREMEKSAVDFPGVGAEDILF